MAEKRTHTARVSETRVDTERHSQTARMRLANGSLARRLLLAKQTANDESEIRGAFS
jgi:hypothetical protein